MENELKHTTGALRAYDGGTGWVIREVETNLRVAHDLKREQAEFIVRACNAHDELAEACRIARDAFGSSKYVMNTSETWVTYKVLLEALKKATGGA